MISLELRTHLYNIIKSDILTKIRFEGADLMNVISSIWNVYQRPATEDSRYRNLGDEIDKHYFLNDDWTEDKLFIGKLKILDDEHNFLRFLEEVLYVYEQINKDGYQYVKSEIEPLLEKENIRIQEDRDENDNIREIRLIVGNENGSRVEDRSLKFYVCDSIILNVIHFTEQSIDLPDDPNCFVLTYDARWDDFGYHTRYHLYYVKDKKPIPFGDLKIMKKGVSNTGTVLPSSFYSLGIEYCSLGQNELLYENMARYFGNQSLVYLNELRDAAVFTRTQKLFEHDSIFQNSLLRDNGAEQMLRLGRFIINGRGKFDDFSFEYSYSPKYNLLNNTTLNFIFKSDSLPYQRTYALIGENGVGKTTLMNKLIFDIVQTKKDDKERHFESLAPLFSCVVAVTYSPFDNYPLNNNKELVNSFVEYEYCGLFQKEHVLLDEESSVGIIKEGIETIWKRGQGINLTWQKMMSKIFNKDEVDKIFKSIGKNECQVNKERLMDLYEKASSGEAIYLSSITSILSKIRLNSILLIDEPEQHLHPSGINLLMGTISELLEQFDSFAIISTHSPYILREVPSSNVMIFHRNGNNLIVCPIEIETFGEDVSVISDMVFDNRSQNKIFESYIERVVKKEDYDYAKAISILRNNDKEPSLYTKMITMSLIENRKQ